jgi:O-succinylbenzoate synthase
VTQRRLWPFRLRLRTPFRGLEVRRGCLISGSQGWGEFAPFDDYDAEADARWLAAAVEQADGRWPQAVRDRVEVNAIIPAVAPEQAAAMAVAAGCRTVKIKVGDPDSTARVAAVREALPDAVLRVDGNGAWTPAQAARSLEELARFGLEYAEQPVRTLEQMRGLRELVDVPLAADEVIRVDRRFDEVAQVADVAILKVAPLGGVAATLEAAARVGLPVVISSALDSSLGLAAGVAAACALPGVPLACGLGTGLLLAEDTTAATLAPDDGWIRRSAPEPPRPDLPFAAQDLPMWQARIAAASDEATHR